MNKNALNKSKFYYKKTVSPIGHHKKTVSPIGHHRHGPLSSFDNRNILSTIKYIII